MATKQEIKQAIIDLLMSPKYAPLFGVSRDELLQMQPREIWNLFPSPQGNPNIGSPVSQFPQKELNKIKDLYNSVKNGDDLDEKLTIVTSVLDNVNLILNPKPSFSGDAALKAYIETIEGLDIDDETKDLYINTYIQGLGGALRDVPVYDPSKIGVPLKDPITGEIQTQPFGGHFGNSAGVYEQLLSNTDNVARFQDWLEMNGLVEQGAFEDTKGIGSELLRMQLAKYMAWIDTNKYVKIGTQDYVNVMGYDYQADVNNPFSNSIELEGENLLHQKMFGYFLNEYKDSHDNVISTFNRAQTEARFQRFMEDVPGALQMEQMVEGAFFTSMNRLPTKGELKEQVRILAESYIDEFNDMNQMYAFIENINMISAPNQAWEIDPDDIDMKQFVDDAKYQATQTFETQYADEMNAGTHARAKSSMDEAMLKSMFG